MRMDSSKTIAPDSLMTREACAKIRYSAKAEVITQRRLRTVHLSAHLGAHLGAHIRHPQRDRGLCGVAAVTQQLEGDDADRVPGCARA